MTNWLPSVTNDPRLVLSSTLIASTWLDMQNGYEVESCQTQEVKSAVLEVTREYLRDKKTGTDDVSMMVYINLLMGELWNCGEGALRNHQKAIADCVFSRGGMYSPNATPVFEIGAV